MEEGFGGTGGGFLVAREQVSLLSFPMVTRAATSNAEMADLSQSLALVST